MKQYIIAPLIMLGVLFISCSMIPDDYHPPTFRKIAVLGTWVAPMDYDIDSREDLEDAITDGIIEGIADVLLGDYPEWRTTSELARICTRCGYDVYLVAPDNYFEERKENVEVAHQMRYEGWLEDDYRDYIRQMKNLISEPMEPTAYILCKQIDTNDDEEEFTLEMREWNGDRIIFSMSYGYFTKHYGEFFCGADVGEEVPPIETEPKIIDGKGKNGDPEDESNSDNNSKGSRIQ